MSFSRRRLLSGLATLGGVGLTGLALGGCTDLSKPTPEKRQFVLTATRPGKAPPPRNGLVLLVRRFTIDPAYQDRGIVTRTDPVTAKSDFYNEFFIEPAQQITGQVTGWIGAAGLFSEITTPTSALAPTHILEGFVAKLYGDLTGAPAAVIELQLLLLDVRGGLSRVLLHPNLERRIPSAGPPASLAEGWNKGLAEILTEFEQSLRLALA